MQVRKAGLVRPVPSYLAEWKCVVLFGRGFLARHVRRRCQQRAKGPSRNKLGVCNGQGQPSLRSSSSSRPATHRRRALRVPSLPRRRRATYSWIGPSESGFTVVEMMVALSILLVVMVSTTFVVTSGLAEIGLAKQRDNAAGLAARTIEEIRALPFSIVSNGLANSDATVSADANINVNGSIWTLVRTGETIPHGDLDYTQTPLVPHSYVENLNNRDYTIAAYPTAVPDKTNTIRISVAVTWHTNLKNTPNIGKVESETVVSSPEGCQTTSNHPFAAPCQAFLYGTSNIGTGGITATSLSGSTELHAALDNTQLTGTSQVEQVSTVVGSVRTSGARLTVPGVASQESGAVTASSRADNDPTTLTGPDSTASLTQSAAPLSGSYTANGYLNSFSVTPSSSDTGSTTSRSAATATAPLCQDTNAVTINTSLSCGGGKVRRGGTASLDVTLSGAIGSTGTIPLASLGQPTNDTRSDVGHSMAAGGTECVQASGEGCAYASILRNHGLIRLGGLPAQVITNGAAPAGWATADNYLIQISNFADTVQSESGLGAAVPSVTRNSGELSYWTGAGYQTQTIDWTSSPPTISVTPVDITDASTGLQVQIQATVTGGSGVTTSDNPSGCSTPCASSATSESPIVGDIVYTLLVGGTTIASYNIHVDFGALSVQTSYQAAPSG